MNRPSIALCVFYSIAQVSGNFVIEEVFNSFVHGVGLLLSICGAVPLLSRTGALPESLRSAATAGLTAYILGLIVFFLSSTLNHSLFLTDASQVFRLVDHGAVFVLIAGTYTPFLLVNIAPASPLLGIALLVGVWALAAGGVVLTACRWCAARGGSTRVMADAVGDNVFTPPAVVAAATAAAAAAAANPAHDSAAVHTHHRSPLRLLLYALQGWCGALPFFLLHSCMAPPGWWLLGGGGAVYSLGLVLYSRDRTTHQLHYWYVLVVAASAMHWLAVFYHMQPPTEACMAEAAARGIGIGRGLHTNAS
jgi:hemolysin III